jgi:predicted nucleotidyltransferase
LVVDSLRQVAGVDSIIAFGSVAQGKASYDSDVDLLITVSKWKKPLEERIHDIISKWTVKMGIPIEAIVISTSAIVDLVKREYQLLFGLLQGYIPLYDKVGIATILHSKKEEIESKYEYHEDVSLWLPRTR